MVDALRHETLAFMPSLALELVGVVAVIALLIGVYVVARLGWRPWVRPGATARAPSGVTVVDRRASALRDSEIEALPAGQDGAGRGTLRPSAPSFPTIVLDRPAPTRYPIVFAHGYMGFESISLPGLRGEYFRGVRSRLEALGYTVVFARVSPTASIERRAQQLADQVARLGAPRVNIVAHSMGGLDARFAIKRLGLDCRVASLTTIGTPHYGTPLADSTGLLAGSRAVRRALAMIGIDGFCDLTTQQMNDFNRAVSDVPDVVYTSVVGAVSGGIASVHAILAPGYAYLLRRAGANDGIVPATSQPWGEVLTEIQADHWAQIGWSGGFDVQGFYAMLAEKLARRGL